METLEHTSITAQKEPNERSDGENAGGAQEFLPDCIRMNKDKRCSKQGWAHFVPRVKITRGEADAGKCMLDLVTDQTNCGR